MGKRLTLHVRAADRCRAVRGGLGGADCGSFSDPIDQLRRTRTGCSTPLAQPQITRDVSKLISIIRRRWVDRPLVVLLVSLAAGLLFASPASAAAWTQPGYLYRYFVWGAQRLISSPQTCEGATRTEHDTIVAVEAYLYENLTNPVQSSRPFFLAMQCPLSISQIIGASNRVPFLVSNCNYPYRPGFLIFRM